MLEAVKSITSPERVQHPARGLNSVGWTIKTETQVRGALNAHLRTWQNIHLQFVAIERAAYEEGVEQVKEDVVGVDGQIGP